MYFFLQVALYYIEMANSLLFLKQFLSYVTMTSEWTESKKYILLHFFICLDYWAHYKI